MNLKELRHKQNLTQEAFAREIGCSSNVYSRYENGKRQPSIDTLIIIAEKFNVTVDYLIGLSSDTNRTEDATEEEFINLYRNADERARNDAKELLRRHLT